MKELTTLYQIIYDDLKDSDMLIGYAKELKDSNKQLADTYMTDAKNRLSIFLFLIIFTSIPFLINT